MLYKCNSTSYLHLLFPSLLSFACPVHGFTLGNSFPLWQLSGFGGLSPWIQLYTARTALFFDS